MPTEVRIISDIRAAGRYDEVVASEAEAIRLVRAAIPHAIQLPAAAAGLPYPAPPAGVLAWYQSHPAEPAVGNLMPHIKYADWTAGRKATGGSWGHLFFPPATGG